MGEVKVEYLKGNDAMQDEFIDFVNYVFHMNGKDNDFYRALPKLYKKEYHPCEANNMTLENGRIVAAVGSFPGRLSVCGTTLSYYGIGNVAVNPYCRSKGYMTTLMDKAVEEMLEEDVDFTVLTGRRNRYSHFSYEVVGRKFSLWMDERNIKHSNYGKGSSNFEFKRVSEQDSEVLRNITELQEKQPLHYYRDTNKIYDILMTWQPVIYEIIENAAFAGYLVLYDNNKVKEIYMEQPLKLREAVAAFVIKEKKDGITFELPEFQRIYIDALTELAENVSSQVCGNFSVFHYQKVIEAFLNLKAMSTTMADGGVILFIHGKRSEEKLHIKIKNGLVSVSQTDLSADYEFTHSQAMEFLFQNYSPLRNQSALYLQSWFPLPLYIFPADLI
ncbi:MAG: acetyltransferase, family [Herbinix sp.]|jgi:predicted GNAT family N-acyltransferase|nr:acetyltransferase, family [Herbinix sp.]